MFSLYIVEFDGVEAVGAFLVERGPELHHVAPFEFAGRIVCVCSAESVFVSRGACGAAEAREG